MTFAKMWLGTAGILLAFGLVYGVFGGAVRLSMYLGETVSPVVEYAFAFVFLSTWVAAIVYVAERCAQKRVKRSELL